MIGGHGPLGYRHADLMQRLVGAVEEVEVPDDEAAGAKSPVQPGLPGRRPCYHSAFFWYSFLSQMAMPLRLRRSASSTRMPAEATSWNAFCGMPAQ